MTASPPLQFGIVASLFIALGEISALAQDCDPQETQELLQPDELFACSVSDDTIILGSDRANLRIGAAYVYRLEDGVWQFQQELTASDGWSGDGFGAVVDVEGARVIIGAYTDDDSGFHSGSAYVFAFDGAHWVEQYKLLPDDGAEYKYFGDSVAISGDRVIVGAKGDSDNGGDSGSVYIFRRNGDAWEQEQKLLASDGSQYDRFGQSVDIDGDVAIVGADATDDGGAVYVYRHDPDRGRWLEETKLEASDGQPRDQFGISVSIDGNAVVGGAFRDDDFGMNSGAAYVFRYDSDTGQWRQEAKLRASDGREGDEFGRSVSIASSRAAVSGRLADGIVYFFEYQSDGSWLETVRLTASDGVSGDAFGIGVSLSERHLVSTAPDHRHPFTDESAAYVFELNCPPNGPTLSTLGSCPGQMGFVVEGAEANARVAFLYARGEGSIEIPPGNPCAGTVLGLDQTAQLADVVRADDQGVATLDVPSVPNAACGRVYVQVVDLVTCTTTNVVLVQ